MDNTLVTAQLAVQGMAELCDDYAFEPTVQTANAVLIRKTVAANACIQTVEKAFEVVGGGAFFRSIGLERLPRDVHGAQFHPLQRSESASSPAASPWAWTRSARSNSQDLWITIFEPPRHVRRLMALSDRLGEGGVVTVMGLLEFHRQR